MNTIPLFLSFFVGCFLCENLSAKVVKILIQGDTQKIMDPKNGKQHNFVPFMAKLLTDPVTKDADFILQMGDIVESDRENRDRPQQYLIAREGWQQLDGKIPYVLNIGNNDNFEEYRAAFSHLPKPYWSNNEGRNFAYNFNAGGIDWLVISLRYGSTNEEHHSVESLIENHPFVKVILIKHEINFNGGLARRLKKYPNVIFILSGHTQSSRALLTGDNGNKIGWIRTCHHNANRDSYLRILLIDTVKGTVCSSFYSPQYERFWHDPEAPYNDPSKGTPWIWYGFNFESGTSNTFNDAEFVSIDMPSLVTPGQKFESKVTFRNTGNSTWSANSRYKLGSQNLKGNKDWGAGTSRTKLSRKVKPGEEYTFIVNCSAPLIEGSYNFRRQMVKENVGWFGDFSENRMVEVTYNVVMDASFENRDQSWQIGSGATITTESRRSGNVSLKIKSGSSEEATIQSISIEPDTEYYFSAWVNTEGVLSGNVIFDIKDVFDKNEGQIIINPGETNKWKKYEGQFNSNEMTSLEIRIFGSNLEGVAYFDDVTVTPLKNAAPIVDIDSFPDPVIYENTSFSYVLNATDPDGDMLTYRALDVPKWLAFDSETGVLQGIAPTYSGVNSYPVTLCVSDGKQEVKHFFYITVVEDKPYDAWSTLHDVSEVSGDSDHDGFPNLLEFALGGDPGENDRSNELFVPSWSDNSVNFTFRRNQQTVNYIIQTSTDLKNWYDYTVVNDSHGFVGDICNVAVPVSEDRKFFKLKVSW